MFSINPFSSVAYPWSDNFVHSCSKEKYLKKFKFEEELFFVESRSTTFINYFSKCPFVIKLFPYLSDLAYATDVNGSQLFADRWSIAEREHVKTEK